MEEQSGTKVGRKLRTVPDSVRASIDGEIANDVRSFDDWLRTRGDAFARKKLGPARFKLWQDDKLTTTQLINGQGKILTLDELAEAIAKTN